MTAATPTRVRHHHPPAPRSGPLPASAVTARGILRIARVHLRTAWKSLLAWPLGLAALVVVIGSSIASLFPTVQSRTAYAVASGASPGTVAFNGRWPDLDTVGGITTNEVGFMGLLLFPLAGILVAVSRTRREEDSGRTELLTSGAIGRLDPLLGALVAASIAFALMVPLIGFGLTVVGLPADGSWRYTLLLTLSALAWLSIGAVCCEVSRDARLATGIGLSLVISTFLIRAIIDASTTSDAGSRLTWLTPMGWLPHAAPYGDARWWPYLALVVLSVVALTGAVVVAWRRDLGSGLLAPKPGPARGTARLGTPLGYAWRLTSGTAIAWCVALVAWALTLGFLANDMTEVITSNPELPLLELLGIERAEDVVTALALMISSWGCAALIVQGVARLGEEEDTGRLGLLLSSPSTRRRVWLVWAGVLAAQALVVLALQALIYGVTVAWTTGESANATSTLRTAAVMGVPVLLVGGFALLVRAVAPRWTPLAWGVIGWAAVVGMLAEALDLSEAARDTSPFNAVGRLPMEDPQWPAIIGLGALTLAGVALSVVVLGRRDLRAG